MLCHLLAPSEKEQEEHARPSCFSKGPFFQLPPMLLHWLLLLILLHHPTTTFLPESLLVLKRQRPSAVTNQSWLIATTLKGNCHEVKPCQSDLLSRPFFHVAVE